MEIKCPNCNHVFELSETIFNDLEQDLRKKLNEESAAQKIIAAEEKKKLEKKLLAEKDQFIKNIESETNERLQEEFDLKSKFSQNQLETVSKKYLESQEKVQKLLLETVYSNQALEEEKVRLLEENNKNRREFENKIQIKVDDEHRLKDIEKEKIIQDQRDKLAEMSRKLSQNSQQIQGESLELDITSRLQSKFIQDKIFEVPKGTQGVDIIQTVRDNRLQECGKLAIEIKNTKSFAKKFIDKIKHDQLEARADVAIIITTTLPNDMKYFGIIDGVLIVHHHIYTSIIEMLRNNLINIYNIKVSNMNRKEKRDILYNYVTEPGFFDKIKSMYNIYIDMKSDLDLEKNSVRRSWGRRERKLEDIVSNINSVWAELSAITGLFQDNTEE